MSETSWPGAIRDPHDIEGQRSFWRWWITHRYTPLQVIGLVIAGKLLSVVTVWLAHLVGFSWSVTFSWP